VYNIRIQLAIGLYKNRHGGLKMRYIEVKSKEFEELEAQIDWDLVEEIVVNGRKQGNSMWYNVELYFEVEGKKYMIEATRCVDKGFEETWFNHCYEI
jgi:hypothetical protein